MNLAKFIVLIQAMFTTQHDDEDNGYSTLINVLIVLACIAVLIFIIKNLSVHTK